jgi:hypothetical protein
MLMRLKWQFPIVPRIFRTEMGVYIGVELRSLWYRHKRSEWSNEDISGILRSYDDDSNDLD